jgi:hypothetical protein
MECSIYDDEIEQCEIMTAHFGEYEPWYSVRYNGMGYVVKVKHMAPIIFKEWNNAIRPEV